MWAGANGGMYFYDGVVTHRVGDADKFNAQVYSIVEHDNKLYIGSNNGLFTYDLETGCIGTPELPTPKEIRRLLLIDNTLWIGSLEGTYAFDLVTGEISDYSAGLPHRSTYSLLRDRRGIIYAGTYKGLARLDVARQQFEPVKVTINGREHSDLFVNCLIETRDGSSILMGTEGSLYRYRPVFDSWEKESRLEGNTIKSLALSRDGHILAGTENGVFDISPEGIRISRHDSRDSQSLPDNEIWDIYTDEDDNIWTGHARGISVASNSKTMHSVSLGQLTGSGEGNEIHNILRDSKGKLWFGGTNGVICISANGKQQWFRHADNSLTNNRIRAIVEDREGNIWLSTDGGIHRFNEANDNFDNFHVVDSKGSHNSNWVYAMVEDGDYFWIGSYLGGLHRVAKKKFDGGKSTIAADQSVNTDSPLFMGKTVRLDSEFINNVVRDTKGNIWILLFRDRMLTKLAPDGCCTKHDILELTGAYPSHISTDAQGRVWCAFDGGAVVFEHDGTHHIVRLQDTAGDEGVLTINKVGDNIWLSTVSNVWSIDSRKYTATLLPIPQKHYTAIYDDTATGKVYLGATDEILEVNSLQLGSLSGAKGISLALNPLSRINHALSCKSIDLPSGGGFDLIISTLDYSPGTVHRYMYKLATTPSDTIRQWVVMPEGANTVSMTGLSMGKYWLMLKPVGSTAPALAVPVTVSAPWYMSWWALLIYTLAVLGTALAIHIYLHRRNLRALREKERRQALENVEKKLTFLSDISHDLKTPLSMIMGPVSILKEKTSDAEARRSLEVVYSNAVKLNDMIHRAIELKHLEVNDESLLILSTFDVVEFCRGIFEAFKENNPGKTFVFHTSCRQVCVEADAVKFESVITNLLSNACKYSDDGATISCGISTHADKVEIVVSDDGLGIPEAEQPLVFQRMYRSASTAKLREGTGIGLYLIKRYLELMHGNIDLYSRPGQGTSFIVTLTVSELHTSGQIAEISDEQQDAGKAKILIVEDNSQISSFIKEILKPDYLCLVAENGRAGLSLASSFLPDLIIADEMMHVMNGTEMLRRLKQNPRLTMTPVIMLTAKSDNETENECARLGVDVFMTKPFDPRLLTARISQLINARSKLKEQMRLQNIIEPKPIEAESVSEKQLAKIAKIVEENISDPDLNVTQLCEKADIPNKQLYRIIKKLVGLSPLDYIRKVRLQKAAMLLGQHRFTVSEVCYMVGFKNPSYFAKCFTEHFGVKPSLYRSDDRTPELDRAHNIPVE